MESRSKYLQYINNASQIMSSLNLKNDELDNLKSAVENTELLIPVVGAFSAGKSTLLNSFLGNNQLPTAITPETALATELRYSQNEYIEAVDSENQIHRYEISELMTIKDNAQNYRFLKLYLNNDNLKAIQPLVLVDMPGFDAPIKNHQEAILSYLNKGVYFIFLTSIEDGNITRTMQRELDNLITLKKKFSFGITKTNLRPQEVVDQVYQHIKEQLVEDYDYTQDIMLLNNDGGANLKEILSSINPEELFKSLFLDVLKDKAISLVQTINLTIATLKETDKESKEKIKLLQESIRNLTEEREKLADEINAKYSGQQLTDVANKVANGLLQEKDILISLAMNNPQSYSEEVVDISKNLLIREMERKFQEINNEISQHIQLKLNNIFSGEDANFAHDLDIGRVSESAKILLEKAQNGISTVSNHLKELADSKNGMYKSIIGSLAIATSVVNPVIEIAILFLPEIINFFQQQAKERQMREKAEHNFVYETVPQIKRKIQEQLPSLLKQQIEKQIEQLNAQVEVSLKQKQQEIEAAENERQEKGAEIESRLAELEAGKQELSTLSNQILFD
ncbi:dynamin family protein [Avibacterium paragallinarum]|uniref:dynamin family protein n=1 Tax=Pasteurellaceae TaxID=712 RepID=UPI00021AD55D|nr:MULTISPECIES: dynamin family protein [Pasteurellaceae]AZI13947.1 hypothetical protein EIA51_04515 [Avibacterium paragallinarum]QIR11411.1 hypothetical protein HBL79_03655 [Avibacterium paragallinarum]QJE09616.1 hypothetical protein HHJ62_04490 [Avibacterium paragallinarum]QJE11812.1 hypothetical protein HHJ61_04495 [Avibacterium paragallinarum]QJE14011.1 hypothetical protein HHJ60_04505 [Avibacterium paragallinarum]